MIADITLHDKTFQLYKKEMEILAAIKNMAAKLNADYADKKPVIVPILNGSFMFASDLMKEISIPCEISFMKVASYIGTSTTGELSELVGINQDLSNRDIIILEDIVDTGHTLAKLIPMFLSKNPASVKVATLLFKPNALKTDVTIDYVGIEIPNDFIVGYGLDYNELGRNLRHIYQLKQ